MEIKHESRIEGGTEYFLPACPLCCYMLPPNCSGPTRLFANFIRGVELVGLLVGLLVGAVLGRGVGDVVGGKYHDKKESNDMVGCHVGGDGGNVGGGWDGREVG